ISSKRTHGRRSLAGRPADALSPKFMGSATPSITHASPWSRCSMRGTRSRCLAATREVQRSGGSLMWESASTSRTPGSPNGAPIVADIGLLYLVGGGGGRGGRGGGPGTMDSAHVADEGHAGGGAALEE